MQCACIEKVIYLSTNVHDTKLPTTFQINIKLLKIQM